MQLYAYFFSKRQFMICQFKNSHNSDSSIYAARIIKYSLTKNLIVIVLIAVFETVIKNPTQCIFFRERVVVTDVEREI